MSSAGELTPAPSTPNEPVLSLACPPFDDEEGLGASEEAVLGVTVKGAAAADWVGVERGVERADILLLGWAGRS